MTKSDSGQTRTQVVEFDQCWFWRLISTNKKKPPLKAGVSKRFSGVCPCFHPVRRFSSQIKNNSMRAPCQCCGCSTGPGPELGSWSFQWRWFGMVNKPVSTNSASLWSPTNLLLPCGCPEFAAFFEVITLFQALLSKIAGHKRVAVTVDSVGEVLACHAHHPTLPSL